jgi:methionyl-tRNA synthetase
MSKKTGFYISTAIAYPNNRMHVGFAWEVIGADMIARVMRMRGKDTFFSTGLDEHSQNVEKAAASKGLAPKDYCDAMAVDIRATMESMDIAYDRFIRTSDDDHQKVAAHLIEKAIKSGHVYKKPYEGLYCDSCEVFYTEKDLVKAADGSLSCPIHKTAIRKVSEENYFFTLSKLQDTVERFLADGKLKPKFRAQEVIEFVKQGLQDFSVSRKNFKYGVPVPGDEDHVIYVWYDALINYLTAVKIPCGDNPNGDQAFFDKYWPADVHVVGKDITRFHTVYWPAMLEAAGLPKPARVWAHGFIHLNGEKMSKTRGNIVTPDAVIADYGVTALRWYMLSANRFDADGNYSDQDLILKYNADLANNIGNLVNRTVNMCRKYFGDAQPQFRAEFTLVDDMVHGHVSHRVEKILGHGGQSLLNAIDGGNNHDPYALHDYCSHVQEFATSLNKYIDVVKPWALAKDESRKNDLETALYELLEGIRVLAVALWPVIPQASVAILEQLGRETDLKPLDLQRYAQEDEHRTIKLPQWDLLNYRRDSRFELKDPKPLFQRIEATDKVTS